MDKMFIVPHSHFDAEVFKTREEYLKWGYSNIIAALKMLKMHTDYKFVFEQVCLVKPFLETYPEFTDEFIEYIKSGRINIVCGMYSMSDVNIPSGESLVRQFLMGKSYFREKLGIDVNIGWTIDSFGHQPQFVQILKKSGIDYLVFGRAANLDFSEFIWEGLDGSTVICHYMPCLYGIFHGSSGSPSHIQGFSQFVKDRYKKMSKFAITENIMVMEGADLSAPVEHTPEMVSLYNQLEDKAVELTIATPKEFFYEIEKHRNKLNKVNYDFNPIFQGCYSARIELKQKNRFMENQLCTAELYDVLAWKIASKDNKERFNDIWEPVLFNQFHDDICGCHVDKVFELIMDRYKES